MRLIQASSAAVVGVLLLVSPGCSGIENGLGRTPSMGWRNWNQFGADINQALMMEIMDEVVSRKRSVGGVPTSLCDLGYCDVGLDDAWQECGSGSGGFKYHDHSGNPLVNTSRFPDLLAMTTHAHSLNLTAGWYLNNCICAETKAAPFQLYKQDVHALAEKFQFDGVKLDGCGTQGNLTLWAELINQTGRRISIENCHWGLTVPTESWCPWNFFRTSYDISLSYGSAMANLQTTTQWARKGLSRPGCWGYADGLQVGVEKGGTKLSFAEARSHFGAWCIVSSPLILGHDVRDDEVTDEIWPVISNKDAIAINQAWAGHSGSPFKEAETTVAFQVPDDVGRLKAMDMASWQFFYKPLGGSKVAVLALNHGATQQALTLHLSDVPALACSPCQLYDVWRQVEGPVVSTGVLHFDIDSHDSEFFVLSEPRRPVAITV